MDTRLSLVLVQQYEAMIFHLYGSSFLKNLGYSLWITTKNLLLISIFCLPFYGLGYTARFFFNTSLSLQIGGLVLLSSVSMGYFLLVPWWIHHNISRTYGMLTVAYQFSLMSVKIILFELPLILSSFKLLFIFNQIMYIPKVEFRYGVLLVIFLFFKYLSFRWNKRFFINSVSGRVEMSHVLKGTLVQALEDDLQNFLNKSWAHWFFYTFLNVLKFFGFIVFLFSFVSVSTPVEFFTLSALSMRRVSYFPSVVEIIMICFPLIIGQSIFFFIYCRYIGGMWAFLHNLTCIGTIIMATPYMIGFCILGVIPIFENGGYINSFRILTPLGSISIGILIAMSYCTFKVYKKIGAQKSR
ncbi:hypothetical protein [Holospora curviuscula]|uniref:Uncharacterized protein n=1 Tax=Holospora curviuscula TaxID=1082868 RepID=A0A2S5R976_9PROT|nr:hypothetical protein [Holospora curviuscula]PPE03857.1 hypothetical protein HCUR_00634 [Holospora curviuscula]